MVRPSKLLRCMAALTAFFMALPSQAWFNGGHMLVAYIAYRNLTPRVRSRVDALLQRNEMYAHWTNGVAEADKPIAAFVKAATWADCIKRQDCEPGYTRDGGDVPPGRPTDAQNIGYADKRMHAYWHFIDLPLAAGAPGAPPKVPNALTEIELLTKAIGSAESDDVKSYDLVWLEHLVGDIHQPLHATSRFTPNHPDGDAGGNRVYFCEKPCKDELHAYWDGLLGDDLALSQAKKRGNLLLESGKPTGASNASPNAWVKQSFDLAKRYVYAPPIGDDATRSLSPRPDAQYAAQAKRVARAQATLAGYRLAALLNKNLK
ncbi:MAG TPA: S1/P1 nuclease [Bryobacteraceae bacterium]|nr:S1/P1 nuclease [Bryobacteraceae bacterium]